MFGLSLIHAGFLAAGLAVTIPVVIHLLFRQRSRTVPIGSIRFLKQVVKEHRRRRRVRQWLLLALRMLALALLALLFARPYWNDAAKKGMQQEIVLLIDRSGSMQAQSAGFPSAFQQAQVRTGEELKRIDENAVVHVALFDSTAVEEIAVEKLAGSKPSQAATDYGLALGWAGDLLAASDRANRQIVLYTDQQRSGLPRGALNPLPPGVGLLVKDVGDKLVRNVTIELAEAVRTELRPEGQVLVRAVVRNHAPVAQRQLGVACELTGPQGVLKANAKLDIPAQGRGVVELPFSISEDGVYRGAVEVQIDDSLSLDNRRYLAFEARHPDRVLLVDGQEGRSVFANETYFLDTALRLTTEETEGRLRSFEPDRLVWEAGEGFPRLDGYRVVVLANVRRLTDEDAARLQQYLTKGGKLLIFVGDQTTRETLAPLERMQLLPGKVAESVVEGLFRVDAWHDDHPALEIFRDPQHGDLRRLTVERMLALEELENGVRPLLSAKGKVLAAERQVGSGVCVYFGTTADRDWTDLPRTRLYVPLVRQILAYLTDQLGDRGLVVNRVIARSTDRAGLESTDGKWIVTNLDPRESALDRIEEEELRRAFGVEETPTEDREVEAQWAKILPVNLLRPEEIWQVIVWLLFAILAAELLLAARVHA